MTHEPISQKEMIEMFGEAMPIEAVELFDNADDKTTLGELRAKLRQIASTQPTGAEVTQDGLVESIAREICTTQGMDPDAIVKHNGPTWEHFEPAIKRAFTSHRHSSQSDLQAKYERAVSDYQDLIMQVESKYPNETRHETARRYIQQAEQSDNECGKATEIGETS